MSNITVGGFGKVEERGQRLSFRDLLDFLVVALLLGERDWDRAVQTVRTRTDVAVCLTRLLNVNGQSMA